MFAKLAVQNVYVSPFTKMRSAIEDRTVLVKKSKTVGLYFFDRETFQIPQSLKFNHAHIFHAIFLWVNVVYLILQILLGTAKLNKNFKAIFLRIDKEEFLTIDSHFCSL